MVRTHYFFPGLCAREMQLERLNDLILGNGFSINKQVSLLIHSIISRRTRHLTSFTTSVLFQRTSSKNNELETRVEELERELSVWKTALKAADDDKKSLHKTVLKLERNIGSLKVRHYALHPPSFSSRIIIVAFMWIGQQPPHSMSHRWRRKYFLL